jgi:HEPN domain-containing protein
LSPKNLPQAYLKKCTSRLRALRVLQEDENHSDVVRESQEVVELCSKAILRLALIDPPHRHDVAAELQQARVSLPAEVHDALTQLVTANHWLRREREISFYGAEDFDPTEGYSTADSTRAFAYAELAVQTLSTLLKT